MLTPVLPNALCPDACDAGGNGPVGGISAENVLAFVVNLEGIMSRT